MQAILEGTPLRLATLTEPKRFIEAIPTADGKVNPVIRAIASQIVDIENNNPAVLTEAIAKICDRGIKHQISAAEHFVLGLADNPRLKLSTRLHLIEHLHGGAMAGCRQELVADKQLLRQPGAIAVALQAGCYDGLSRVVLDVAEDSLIDQQRYACAQKILNWVRTKTEGGNEEWKRYAAIVQARLASSRGDFSSVTGCARKPLPCRFDAVNQ